MKFAAAFCLALAFAIPVAAQTVNFNESVLYTFTGTNELLPDSLMQASDGNFYGVLPSVPSDSPGFIYQVTPAGAYTQIYAFDGAAHGAHPNGRLIEGPDGYLYGVTSAGGAHSEGVFYKIPIGTSGALQVLYTVPAISGSNPTNCLAAPGNGFTLGSDGKFYNATTSCIFSMSSSGTVNILGTIECCTTGFPATTVLQASDGNYYTASPGALNVYNPTNSTVINNSISNDVDCIYPTGDLVEGSDGKLYYLTVDGTVQDNFCRTTTAAYTTPIFGFTATGTQRELPPMILGADGLFYGVEATGPGGDGDMWQASTGGRRVGFTFDYTDGAEPQGGMIQGNDGALYGVTSLAGSPSSPLPGEVFKLVGAPQLPAPVQMSFSVPTPSAGSSATIKWKVLSAFSTTMQQCYAYGNWSGQQTGTFAIGAPDYSGSASVVIPANGIYTYALTCGGRESAVLTSNGLVATSNTLTVSPNPVADGANATVAITVSGPGGTPTGQVQLRVGTEVVDTLTLSGGKASVTFDTNTFAADTYPLTAYYSGDTTFLESQSSTVDVVVKRAASTTTVTATPNPVTPPGSVIIKATITNTDPGVTPAGYVIFYYGTDSLGQVNLAAGSASLQASTSGIPAGTYAITAKYSGDTHNSASQGAVNVVIK